MGLVSDIKAQAIDNRTKIQSSDCSALEKILNKMFYLQKDAAKEGAFVKQVITRGLESSERVGLHASALIVSDKKFCLRQQLLSLIYKPTNDEDLLNVGLKMVFEEGNAIHEKWQRLFLRAGYSAVGQLDVTQFNEQWKVSYTPDIICTIPQFYDGLMVGEIKSVNTFQFLKMEKHPSASKQCQWYMQLCINKAKADGTWNGKDYKKGFVLCEDKNTQAIKLEVYNYELDITAPFVDRCEDIKAAYKRLYNEKKMVARPADATSCNCKRCQSCPMVQACWNTGAGKVKIKGT